MSNIHNLVGIVMQPIVYYSNYTLAEKILLSLVKLILLPIEWLVSNFYEMIRLIDEEFLDWDS